MSPSPKPVLLWDSTKTGHPRYPSSGMKTVAIRLRTEIEALGYEVRQVRGNNKSRSFQHHQQTITKGNTTPFLTPEVYCEDERPGILEWLEYHQGTKAAVFYDAIPIKYPEITWPQSVYR
jgi:hypothetical protein